MIKLIDVTFQADNKLSRVCEVFDRHELKDQYARFLKDKMKVLFIRHSAEAAAPKQESSFNFFKNLGKFWYLPFKSNNQIAKQNPDVLLVQGLDFPLQLLALRLQCGFKTKIISQHHGEKPYTGVKLIAQKIAAKFTDAYIFQHLRDAADWKRTGVIKESHKIVESLEASTYFTPADRTECRAKLSLPKADKVFLWVGRLDADKDPFTVLRAFKFYLYNEPSAKLYMVYQNDGLLENINAYLNINPQLKEAVTLVGHVPHQQLATWYSAADYYLAGSPEHDSGYALLEAMACGCFPVVTDIPAFRKLTNDGEYGLMYKPGDTGELYQLLKGLKKQEDISAQSIIQYFKSKLSFQKIADDIYTASETLCHTETAEIVVAA